MLLGETSKPAIVDARQRRLECHDASAGQVDGTECNTCRTLA